jgi:hypothetical protein
MSPLKFQTIFNFNFMRVIILGAMIWFLFSCEMHTTMELDIPAPKPKLVVNSFFSADSVWNVQVWKSQGALAAKNVDVDRVTNATLVVMDGTKEIPLYYNPKLKFYRSKPGDGKAEQGKSYTLKASAPDYESISATVAVPEPVQVLDVISTTAPRDDLSSNGHSRNFEIRFKDPANTVNYYALCIIALHTFTPQAPKPHDYTPKNLSPLSPTFADDFYDEWFYLYGSQLGEYNLLFNDQVFNGQDYTFKVTTYEQEDNGPLTYLVLLKSLSEDYYNYRVTYNLQKKTKDDPFAQPVQIFSNVRDGYGIFAGYSQSLYQHRIR